jgi:hypothetical protein
VTPDYEAKLLAVVEQAPRALGLPFSNWTPPTRQYLAADPIVIKPSRELLSA